MLKYASLFHHWFISQGKQHADMLIVPLHTLPSCSEPDEQQQDLINSLRLFFIDSWAPAVLSHCTSGCSADN